MKKTILFIATILLSTSMFARNTEPVIRTVFSQNFETATFGKLGTKDSIGGIQFLFWAPAVMTPTLDSTTPISGLKSLMVDIPTPDEWWNSQIRIDNSSIVNRPIDLKAGFKYRMTYKVRSTVPDTIVHQFHKVGNPTDVFQTVTLAGGNVVETKTFTTQVMVEDGSSTDFAWYWLCGGANSAKWKGPAATLTFDDIIIEELGEKPNSYTETFEAAIPDFEAVNGNAGISFVALTDYTDPGAPFSNSTASMTRSIDTASPISGTKSLKLNVTNVGNDSWSLQMRMDSLISYTYENRIKVSYKIKSNVPASLIFQSDYDLTTEDVTLVGGNVVETKEFISTPTNDLGQANFTWMLGRPNVPCTIWIDDIVISDGSFSAVKSLVDNLKMLVYTSSHQLQIKTSANGKVEVLDLVGRTVVQRIVNANELTTISMDANRGCFLVRATDNQGNTSVRKVIVQ